VASVIGREAEQARLARAIGAPAAHRIALIGEAGSGKTTLMEWVAETAAGSGAAILRTTPTAMEEELPLAGLLDLLEPVLDRVSIPRPQRRAIEVALLREEPAGPPPDAGGVAFATLSVLRALGAAGAAVVLVDDAHWLDAATTSCLAFAARRLTTEPVGIIIAGRHASPLVEQLAEAIDERIDLGPLSMGAIRRMLRERVPVDLPRPLLGRIHETSGGNPVYALALTEAIAALPVLPAADQPLPVPSTLAALLDGRLAGVESGAGSVLDVVALTADATPGLVGSILGGDDDIEAALRTGLVRLDGDGRLLLQHPLLAAAAVQRMTAARRRALHAAIAEHVTDPDERALHHADAVDGEDARAADELDAAGRRAAARGATVAAARWLERAVRLTPSDADGLGERQLAAAEATKDTGDWRRAIELAQMATRVLPAGAPAMRARVLDAELRDDADGLRAALADVGDDATERARIGLALGGLLLMRDFPDALAVARAARDDAARAMDASLLAQAVGLTAWLEGASLDADPFETLAAMPNSPDDSLAAVNLADFTRATLDLWRDAHAEALAGFEAARAHDERRGDVWGQAHALLHLAHTEWRRGDRVAAEERLAETFDMWPEAGYDDEALRWLAAALASERGELETAARMTRRSGAELPLWRMRFDALAGRVALREGDVPTAIAELERADAGCDAIGVREPGMRLHESDLIEAYVAAGRLDEAHARAEALIRTGDALARRRAQVTGRRGRALALAAGGRLDEAADELEAALAVDASAEAPVEQAAALLALGTVRRRLRQYREARNALAEAAAAFAAAGATWYLARTQAEAARIGGRTAQGNELTASETRVAELVAAGLSNREIASELVVTVKTVESALTRIYRKQGVRSRSQLVRALAESGGVSP
jgi:DNA-binding CsgD family transcriptional regulator